MRVSQKRGRQQMNDSRQDEIEDKISPIHALEGMTLKTGWKVTEKVYSKAGSTGGYFSVCYLVEKDGRIGFLKALNIHSFLTGEEDHLGAVGVLINTFKFEKELLTRCRDKKLSRVSKLLEASFENIKGYIIPNVYYMIFEKAERDVRQHIRYADNIDDAWKLRSLHNIAMGIRQLHGINISHQDLKPSNIFVFDNGISKVGDLGRALCSTLSAPHEKFNFTGAKAYAPPEVVHGFVLPNWNDKVFAIDCYMLGSMASFYFTGQTMPALLSQCMNPSINILMLSFEDALPYWILALESALAIIGKHTEDIDGQERLINAIRMLCFPDPRERGHYKNVEGIGNNFQLERFVSTFNFLAEKAEYRVTRKR